MKISVKKAQELLETAPYTDRNTEHYEDFCNLREILKNPDISKYPQLCDGRVIAVWYLSGLVFDDFNNPQLLVRTTGHKDAIDKVYFGAYLNEFAHNDVAYDYDKDLIGGDTMIIGQQRELVNEIASGRVYTIYNRNREEDRYA